MASKLINIGHAVARLFGSNFTSNEVEEIGSTDNRIWTESQICSSNGNELIVNDEGQGHVVLRGKIDEGNSTEENLLADGVFTGVSIDTLDYSSVTIAVYSDVASATNGLKIQYSNDGVTWSDGETYDIIADRAKFFTPTLQSKCMRVVYINGSSPTTDFYIHTTLRKVPIKWSSHNIKDPIRAEDDAELVKSVLTGLGDDGTFRNVDISVSNRLKTVSQPYGYAVAEGDILNHVANLKFGTRTTVSAGTSSLIWEGTNAFYTYLTSAEILKVSSSSAQDGVGGTGIRTLYIEGLDANYNLQNEIITMNGVGIVLTTKSYIRVFRAYGVICGTSFTSVGNINITNNAGTNQLLIINAGDSQTLMTMWTVPANYVLYLTAGTFSTNSNKGARVSFFTRQLDGGTLYPWRIRYRSFIFSGNNNFPFSIPFVIPAKTDLEVRVLTPVSAGNTSAGATFEGWYKPV